MAWWMALLSGPCRAGAGPVLLGFAPHIP